MKLIISILFCIFTGEIGGGNCPLNGFVLCPSHLLSNTSLNNTIMKRHGLSYTSVYGRWYSMVCRCGNEKVYNYHNYGGRGIRIYEKWKFNFNAFYDYVMLLPNAMKDSYSIDRINNNGNYEPGNLRWADRHTQSANQKPRRVKQYVETKKTPYNTYE